MVRIVPASWQGINKNSTSLEFKVSRQGFPGHHCQHCTNTQTLTPCACLGCVLLWWPGPTLPHPLPHPHPCHPGIKSVSWALAHGVFTNSSGRRNKHVSHQMNSPLSVRWLPSPHTLQEDINTPGSSLSAQHLDKQSSHGPGDPLGLHQGSLSSHCLSPLQIPHANLAVHSPLSCEGAAGGSTGML